MKHILQHRIRPLFNGRMNRKNFLIGMLLKYSLTGLLVISAVKLNFKDEILWQFLLTEFFIFALWIFGVSVALRRMYDLNWNKIVAYSLAIICTMPVFFPGIILLLALLLKGDQTTNKYGAPDNRKFFESLINSQSSEE